MFLGLTLINFAAHEACFFLPGLFVRVIQEIQPPKGFDVIQFDCPLSQFKTHVNHSPSLRSHLVLIGQQRQKMFFKRHRIPWVIQIHKHLSI